LSEGPARAAIVLTDGNSTVSLNQTEVGNWTVGTTNQLDQESFWYRIGNSGGQSPISALTPITSTNDGLGDFEQFTYGTTSGFQVVVKYSLTGGSAGSQTSDLAEIVKVSNDGMSPQTFHLIEYTNFNLDDLTTGQTVTITGGNTATDIGNGLQAQTVVSPKPGEYEASNTTASPDLLSDISNASTPYTLKDVASAATGDGEWAFEWDISIGCDSSYVISIDKNIKAVAVAPVPEPGTGVIALLGSIGLVLRRRRQRSAPA
jgi:hypothetical protein